MFKLAGRYNRSTFVQLVHNNKNVATSQFREAKSMNLSNLAVASLNIDAGFGKKLMNCPDFLRYQFIGIRNVSLFRHHAFNLCTFLFPDFIFYYWVI